jgi:hypothetical protein
VFSLPFPLVLTASAEAVSVELGAAGITSAGISEASSDFDLMREADFAVALGFVTAFASDLGSEDFFPAVAVFVLEGSDERGLLVAWLEVFGIETVLVEPVLTRETKGSEARAAQYQLAIV